MNQTRKERLFERFGEAIRALLMDKPLGDCPDDPKGVCYLEQKTVFKCKSCGRESV